MPSDSLSFEPRHLFPSGGPEASGANPGNRDSIRESHLYKRILGQSLRHVGLEDGSSGNWEQTECSSTTDNRANTPHLVPPRSGDDPTRPVPKAIRGLTGEDNERLIRQFTEIATTAATVAARDARDAVRNRRHVTSHTAGRQAGRALAEQGKSSGEEPGKPPGEEQEDIGLVVEPTHASGGHDAPNWSKSKSSIILLGATLLYAIIAEILVNTVDVVLESVDIDEKFLGITLFALVPNTTEFLVSWSPIEIDLRC